MPEPSLKGNPGTPGLSERLARCVSHHNYGSHYLVRNSHEKVTLLPRPPSWDIDTAATENLDNFMDKMKGHRRPPKPTQAYFKAPYGEAYCSRLSPEQILYREA